MFEGWQYFLQTSEDAGQESWSQKAEYDTSYAVNCREKDAVR